jgi:hypothetical protein
MEESERFRQYAAECLRLAKRASEKDRAVLMEIASAWIKCAEQVERKKKASEER